MNRMIYRLEKKISIEFCFSKNVGKIHDKGKEREKDLWLSNSLCQREYRAVSLERYRRTRLGLYDRLLSCCSVTYCLIKKKENCGGKEKRESTRGGTRSVFGRYSRDHARDRAVSNNSAPPPSSSRRLIET